MGPNRSSVPGCRSAGRVTVKLLLSLLATTAAAWTDRFGAAEQVPLLPVLPPTAGHHRPTPPTPSEHDFTLRHVFHRGTRLQPDLHRRYDVREALAAYTQPGTLEDEDEIGPFRARSAAMTIQRLANRKLSDTIEMITMNRLSGSVASLPEFAWTMDEVAGPNHTDKETVLNLSRMAANSYNPTPDDPEWDDIKPPFNRSVDFGWQGDGLRGHVFADKTNSTIVISIKGTTSAIFDGAETTTNDKENDNLFFGCCCGQQASAFTRQVCDCATSTYTCNNTCVTHALKKENRYWRASVELYANVTELYPNTENIWLIGHSLGGSVSALLGLTVGLPVVTFEAPGEAMAASRLGLPSPPGFDSRAPQRRTNTGAFHFGHTADPVFTGTCTGASSVCVWAGYALQTVCHTGSICVYDTVEDWHWRNHMTNHGIRTCIKNVYEKYESLATCVSDADCDVDCPLWKYYDSNHTETTTSKTSTSTSLSLTRTETCKTPGWWGCLDETTSYGKTTLTTTVTTTTCSSYGWFGRCLDPITTTSTETVTTTLRSITTTTDAPTEPTTSSASTTCLTPGVIYGCRDKTTVVPKHVITSAPKLLSDRS